MGKSIIQQTIRVEGSTNVSINQAAGDINQVPQSDSPLIENQDAIKRLARTFSTYENRTPAITDKDVEAWLRQFENRSWRRLALRLLEKIEYYDPERMRGMFSHFLENILPREDRGRTVISLFGSLIDSSSIINYTLGRVIMEYGFEAQPLETILNRWYPEEKVILFVDDNIGSGKQAVQIFRDWLGIKDRVVNDRHGLPLNADQIDKLKRFKMHLFTFVGFEEGKENIRKELQDLGLNMGSVYSFDKLEQSIGCFHEALHIFDTPGDRQEAKRMAKEIGMQLFEDKIDWPKEKKEERSLGYGNSQKLIVFYYNTPTSTLPILWKQGTYNGKPWKPLFPRREKKNG